MSRAASMAFAAGSDHPLHAQAWRRVYLPSPEVVLRTESPSSDTYDTYIQSLLLTPRSPLVTPQFATSPIVAKSSFQPTKVFIAAIFL
ncbi:uncharacterized protein EI97DRAFT_207791 [Westerdykella ornata]|uniref:Uncharacterized protein n=1 Tax=Westerdykella ornata TaxID=318751 RepID=A0A6A6J7F3_WESOR|nr:uncharacterized protein EI97DRAFT_207791 [Westerdykella ornata]KAF2272501.1 hypothetical protein EI97DRAFT_207791 [Westerdykella ornata]